VEDALPVGGQIIVQPDVRLTSFRIAYPSPFSSNRKLNTNSSLQFPMDSTTSHNGNVKLLCFQSPWGITATFRKSKPLLVGRVLKVPVGRDDSTVLAVSTI